MSLQAPVSRRFLVVLLLLVGFTLLLSSRDVGGLVLDKEAQASYASACLDRESLAGIFTDRCRPTLLGYIWWIGTTPPYEMKKYRTDQTEEPSTPPQRVVNDARLQIVDSTGHVPTKDERDWMTRAGGALLTLQALQIDYHETHGNYASSIDSLLRVPAHDSTVTLSTFRAKGGWIALALDPASLYGCSVWGDITDSVPKRGVDDVYCYRNYGNKSVDEAHSPPMPTGNYSMQGPYAVKVYAIEKTALPDDGADSNMVRYNLDVEISRADTGRMPYSSILFGLRDAAGREYAAHFLGKKPILGSAEDLAPDERARGWLAFDLPQSANALSLVFDPPLTRYDGGGPPAVHIRIPLNLSGSSH